MSQTPRTRRQVLEESVAAKPEDAFPRYALAMECKNIGDFAAAEEHFEALLVRHPEYVPTYFHYGQLLTLRARTDQARQVLSRGLAVARKAGDQHAASEIEAALLELP